MKALSKKYIYALYLTAFIFSASLNAQQQTYLVTDGQGSVITKTGNPEEEPGVVEWQIWLYPEGKTAEYKNRIGMLDSKTYEGALKKLKASQDIDRVYAKWCNMEYKPQPYTGPIALIKENKRISPDSKSKLKDAYRKIAELKRDLLKLYKEYKQLKKIYDAGKQAKDALDQTADVPIKTPLSDVGKVLSEYADNLLEAAKRVNALHKNLDDNLDISFRDIEKNFSEINNSLNSIDVKRQYCSNVLNNFNSPSDDKKLVDKNSLIDTHQKSSEVNTVNNDRSNEEWNQGSVGNVAMITVYKADQLMAVFVSDIFDRPKSIDFQLFSRMLSNYLFDNLSWNNKFHLQKIDDHNYINVSIGDASGLYEDPKGLVSAMWNEALGYPLSPKFCNINYNNKKFTFSESESTPSESSYFKFDFGKKNGAQNANSKPSPRPKKNNNLGAGNVK